METTIDYFNNMKSLYSKGMIPTLQERIDKLSQIKEYILKHRDELAICLEDDFHKPQSETYLFEIFPVISEINHTLKNLKQWMKPKKVKTPWSLAGNKSYVHYQPKGVILIIAPWNYPFNLAIVPFLQAISAGNRVILRPSATTPNTRNFIKKMINSIFENDYVHLFEGNHEQTNELLKKKFNHIFFTGSPEIGKHIMSMAALNLIPVTLELGGKSPAIIHSNVNLKLAAKKIVWGRFINAGQTCLAPDYVLVPTHLKEALIINLKKIITKFYNIKNNQTEIPIDFTKIINQRQFSRIKDTLQHDLENGAKLECGGIFNDENLFISPTIISEVDFSSQIMTEEIFGPILPILTYESLDDILEQLNQKDIPLALYLFSKDKKAIEKTITKSYSGGMCINEVIMHVANTHLPFGGLGKSGMGHYHGHFGFKTFSHEKAVMLRKRKTMIEFLYPPYTKYKRLMISYLVKYLSGWI